MPLIENTTLEGRAALYRDRTDAGVQLARMLAPVLEPADRLLAIPAGGVPVAAALARQVERPFGVVVVSKITLPWNSEVGFGAVAWDGTVRLNEELIRRLGLTGDQVERGIAQTRERVQHRVSRFGCDPAPDLSGGVVLIDDGLASGFTMQVGVEAARRAGASRIIVAVPTGLGRTLRLLESMAEQVICPNVREGLVFAVADAYREWRDISEQEAMLLFSEQERRSGSR